MILWKREKIKLSIIVPIYNKEKYIKECLESIIKGIEFNNYGYLKKEDNIEIILINDGSTDKSKTEYDKYIKTLKLETKEIVDIKIYENKNNGVSYTRNFGIEKAQKEYIFYVDADDKLEENWFKIIKENVKENIYDVIYFRRNWMNNNKNLKNQELIAYILGLDKEIRLSSLWSALYKKSVIKDNNIKFEKDVIIGEDMLFNIDYAINSEKNCIINKGFYKYRNEIGSITNTYSDKYIKADISFKKALKDRLELLVIKKEISEDYMRQVIIRNNINAFFNLLVKISYIKNIKEAEKKLKEIESEFNVIKNENRDDDEFLKYMDKKQQKIYKMYENKEYKKIYIIYRTKNIIKNGIKKVIALILKIANKEDLFKRV